MDFFLISRNFNLRFDWSLRISSTRWRSRNFSASREWMERIKKFNYWLCNNLSYCSVLRRTWMYFFAISCNILKQWRSDESEFNIYSKKMFSTSEFDKSIISAIFSHFLWQNKIIFFCKLDWKFSYASKITNLKNLNLFTTSGWQI